MNLGIFYSIITPCYNSSKYIRETYASLSSQTYSNWEWIVVDDCSTDNSFEILQSIAKQDSRIKLFKTQGNSGAAVARNMAIENSQGHYLAFLDIDDLWHENKLHIYYKQLQDKNIPFGYSNYLKIDSMGTKGSLVILTPDSVGYGDLLKTCSICTSAAVIRRDVIGQTRMRPELRRGQDYIFWLDILKKTSLASRLSREALTFYRVGNTSSLSNNKFKKALGQWRMYRNYLKLNLLQASYYFSCYAIHGYLKHKKY